RRRPLGGPLCDAGQAPGSCGRSARHNDSPPQRARRASSRPEALVYSSEEEQILTTTSSMALRKRPRRVVLTSVVVDAIDDALDGMSAHATILVTARPDAHASISQEVSARVQLCRPTGVCEPSPAERLRRVG